MMKYKHLLTLILMTVLYSSCKQNKASMAPEIIEASTKNLVSAYGPNRMVRSVKQAKNGDMLIVSYSGVWRYDGKMFTNITTAISSPSFWDVLEDKKGNLWISTKDSGVYFYDGKSFLHYTTEQGLPSNMALHLYEDRAGNIWFSTGGATRYDGKSFKTFTIKEGLPDNSVNTFMEDKSGKLWIGTGGDACYYDGKTFTVLRNKEGKGFYNVWSFTEDKKGNIWFGGSIITHKTGSIKYIEPGLWRYDGTNITKVSDRSTTIVLEDHDGNILTNGAVNPNGTGSWKWLRYDQKTLNQEKPIVTEIMTVNTMLCKMTEAKDGSIWMGSGKGVYRWDGKTVTNFMPTREQMYQIDQKESLITWKGSMKLIPDEKHVGTVSISSADLWVPNNQLVGGNFTIDMNSMEYGDKKDKNTPIQHLQSADYFDVKRFPFATIEIAQVDSLTDKTFQITGYLTIKSVTHLVSFPATIEVQNGILNASAKLTIDRTNWGINYRSGKFFDKITDQTVSEEIEFIIKIVAKK